MNLEQLRCSTCRRELEPSDAYEYRGFIFCEPHFDEGTGKVDKKRTEVIAVTEASVASQRNGEFANNRGKYHLGNVASDGLPIIRPKEPQVLKDYERGRL